MPYLEIPSGDHPCVQQLAHEVEALYDEREPSTFWRCRRAFDDFARSSALSDLANDALLLMLERPTEPPLRWGVGKFTLVQKRSYSLVLGWSVSQNGRQKEMETLNTYGGHAFVQLCSRVPTKVRYFGLDGVDFEIFDPCQSLKYCREEVLNPSETIEIDGERFIADFEERSAVCLLVLQTKALWPHIWSFDRDSLHPWTISAADKQTSELRAALKIFRELRYVASEHVVQQLASHPVHDVRWEAVKTLVALNPVAGAAALRRAALDPHPHVRNAATRSLASSA